MELERFKEIVVRVAGPPLEERGYHVDPCPPIWVDEVWFEKTLQQGVYTVIGFQPSELAPEYFNSFCVNLTRNKYRSKVSIEQMVSGSFLSERLASWLWIDDRNSPEWESDHWWHFRNEMELEAACLDALDKLLQYGLPLVEDLNSTSKWT